MGLVLPVPSSEPGPAWALELITAWGLVDSHDHTTGRGARLSQNSILFTADFSANSFGISGLKNLALVLQSGTLTAQNSLYTKNTGELVYVDASGNQVQLTLNGGLNLPASTRGIGGNYATDPLLPSLLYTTLYKTYTFTTNGTALAVVKTGGLVVGTFTVSTASLTIAATDPYTVYAVDTSVNTVSITLPTIASQNTAGRIFVFKDISGSANVRNITINVGGPDNIDNALSVVINSIRGVVRLVAINGTTWSVI